jgi:hypothetical protein
MDTALDVFTTRDDGTGWSLRLSRGTDQVSMSHQGIIRILEGCEQGRFIGNPDRKPNPRCFDSQDRLVDIRVDPQVWLCIPTVDVDVRTNVRQEDLVVCFRERVSPDINRVPQVNATFLRRPIRCVASLPNKRERPGQARASECGNRTSEKSQRLHLASFRSISMSPAAFQLRRCQPLEAFKPSSSWVLGEAFGLTCTTAH